jgi:hypothetical protein
LALEEHPIQQHMLELLFLKKLNSEISANIHYPYLSGNHSPEVQGSVPV